MSEIKDKSNRRIYEKSSFSRIFTILVIIIVAIFVLVSLIIMSIPPRGRPAGSICANNMAGLGKALYLYRNDYDGHYPTGDDWCDLLVNNYNVSLESLFCGGSDAKMGESSYTLNKNIAGKKSSEIPKDVVLLFETNRGWNQVGGPELLALENHKGWGCNVLFNDLHVEIVKAERLGELKWDTEKKDSESIE